MRVFLGIVFDRFGGSSIRITLSKYRVNRTALDAVVPGLYLRLCIGLGLFDKVRQGIALLLQFCNCGLHLWVRCRNIRQLNDIRITPLGQKTQRRQVIRDTLFFG